MRRLLVAVVLLVLGAGVAYGLDSGLRLSWTPAEVMDEPSGLAPLRYPTAAAVGSVTVNRRSPALDLAAKAVTDAGDGPGVLRVVVEGASTDESYRLDGLTLSAPG